MKLETWRSYTLRTISSPCEDTKRRGFDAETSTRGDLVLRLQQDNRGRHKLSPPWEGPYIIAEVLKPST